MVDVIAWPPVGLSAWEPSHEDIVSVSRSLVSGKRFLSAAQPRRRVVSATVQGRGIDAAGAGFMEMLKDFLAGGENLVRIECQSALWHRTWGTRGAAAEAVVDGDWTALDCSGFAAGEIVARPHDLVTFTTGGEDFLTRALTVARSDGAGDALIRVRNDLSGTGTVVIGGTESIVFEPVEIPRAVQPAKGDWAYSWSFREVFEAETDGFVEVDPWS